MVSIGTTRDIIDDISSILKDMTSEQKLRVFDILTGIKIVSGNNGSSELERNKSETEETGLERELIHQ